MLELLQTYYLEKWDELFPNITRPPKLNFVCNVKKWKKILWVLDGRTPIAVAKISHIDSLQKEIIHEHASLQMLQRQLAPIYNSAIPRPLALDEINSHLVLSMSYLSGTPMEDTLPSPTNSHGRVFFRQVEGVFEWLAGFQNQIKTKETVLTDEHIETQFILPVTQLLNQSSASEEIRDFVALYCSAVRELKGSRISSVLSHGDFFSDNILWSGNRLAIIDWADMSCGGGPLDDVFFFFCALRLFVHQNFTSVNVLKAFSNMFLEDNDLSRRISEVIRCFCPMVGVDERMMWLLFPLFLAKMSSVEKDMTGLQSQMKLNQHWMERFIFYAQHARGSLMQRRASKKINSKTL